MDKNNNYFETNKTSWNKRVAVHAASKMYDLESFKKGKSSLMKYEINALGDVKDKSLLHLQCHFGQDTLSWSRLGAKCVGVDLSDAAIKIGEELNAALKLDAQFVTCNVLETSKYVNDQFDIVFTSYGVIGWLPDLKPWAKMIAERLKPGGVFYMVEFHPIVWMFDYDYSKDRSVMKYAYHREEVIHEVYEGTYADKTSKMKAEDYSWNHSFSEIINALIQAGLQINYLNEHDESPYNILPNLEETSKGYYSTTDKLYPLIFELKAIKK